MTKQSQTRTRRPAQELICPLQPMCGVLGVALTWHLSDPAAGEAAARDVARRQLAIWALDQAPLVDDVDLVLGELIASSVEHGVGPVFLEIAMTSAGVAFALRPARASDWAAPQGVGRRGLEVAEALSDELTVCHFADGGSHAYIVRLDARPHPQRPSQDHAADAEPAGRSPRMQGHGTPDSCARMSPAATAVGCRGT